MTKPKSHWLRDLLLIPLIVGLVVAGFTYGLPKLLERGKELSYSIEGPTTYIDQQELGNVVIEINDVPISRLFVYKVRLWNSGDTPLVNVPVRFVFNTDRADFEIFGVNHDTQPKYEFGEISEEEIGNNSRRFVYALLNPGDEDNLTFLTNDSPELEVHARAEGLVVKHIQPRDQLQWLEVLTGVLAGLGSALGVGFKTVAEILARRKKSEPE